MPALSLGPPVGQGHTDSQEPHEVYVLAAGRPTSITNGVGTAVSAGSIGYVPAGAPHRFLDVSGDLRVYVMFAPPEPS